MSNHSFATTQIERSRHRSSLCASVTRDWSPLVSSLRVLICTESSYTARAAGMLHVLRGLGVPNRKADGNGIRRTRFVDLV